MQLGERLGPPAGMIGMVSTTDVEEGFRLLKDCLSAGAKRARTGGPVTF
jgi:hypothetical protein